MTLIRCNRQRRALPPQREPLLVVERYNLPQQGLREATELPPRGNIREEHVPVRADGYSLGGGAVPEQPRQLLGEGDRLGWRQGRRRTGLRAARSCRRGRRAKVWRPGSKSGRPCTRGGRTPLHPGSLAAFLATLSRFAGFDQLLASFGAGSGRRAPPVPGQRRRGPTGAKLGVLPEVLPQSHQRLAQAVEARPVPPVTPVGVVPGVLYNRPVPRAQQQLEKRTVLRELRQQRGVHDAFLHRLPVWAQWPSSVSAHRRRPPGRAAHPNKLLVGSPGKLLGLEVMLRGGPPASFQEKRMGGEVGKPSKAVPFSVKPHGIGSNGGPRRTGASFGHFGCTRKFEKMIT
eukprot:RCo026772